MTVELALRHARRCECCHDHGLHRSRRPAHGQALRQASYVAGLVRDIDRTQQRRLGNAIAEELSPREALELYLDSKETPPERKAELMRYAETIFRED